MPSSQSDPTAPDPSDAPLVRTAVRHGIAVVTLSDPAHRNALSRPARFSELVVRDGNRFGPALDVDRRPGVSTVVDQAVLDEAIAMPGEILAAFGAEEDAHVLAAANFVERDEVVGVAMPDRDADAIAFNGVLLGQSVLDAPTKEGRRCRCS